MANMSPRRAVSCPACLRTLHYVTTRHADGYVPSRLATVKAIADVQVYECAAHGRFHAGPDGRLKRGA